MGNVEKLAELLGRAGYMLDHKSGCPGVSSRRPKSCKCGAADLVTEIWGALAALPDPDCEYCGGRGQRYWHTEDCTDDLCALAGGIHDCRGQVEVCPCVGSKP